MIIAVDFDGTIVDHEFPKIGPMKPDAIAVLKVLQENGHKIILWTCRTGLYLSEAVDYLRKEGFNPDAINENITKGMSFGWPKVVADYYLDDRSYPPFTSFNEFLGRVILEGKL